MSGFQTGCVDRVQGFGHAFVVMLIEKRLNCALNELASTYFEPLREAFSRLEERVRDRDCCLHAQQYNPGITRVKSLRGVSNARA